MCAHKMCVLFFSINLFIISLFYRLTLSNFLGKYWNFPANGQVGDIPESRLEILILGAIQKTKRPS